MKKRILSLVLCAAMLLSMCLFLGAGVTNSLTVCDSSGEAVKRVDLPVNQKISLTAQAQSAAENDAYQWQIQAAKNVWANILGSDTQTLELSYPMVASALSEKNTVQIRCRLTSAETGEATFSDAVTVEVTAATAVDTPASADAAAAPVLRSPAKAAAAASDAPEYGTYTIIIKYQFADGTQAAPSWTAKVAKGSDYSATITSPTVVGYAPNQEQEKVTINETNIQDNITRTVTYHPALVDFTVKYYQQNVGDDKYMLSGTETKQGYTKDPVSKYATGTDGFDVNYDGFTRLLYDDTATIAADGSTVVELYYDRNYYLMNFDLDGGYGVEPIYARYGAPINVGTPTKPGYTFKEWTPKLPATMPVDGGTYTAKWTVGNAKYVVQYWQENANDDGYSYVEKVDKTGTVGTTVNGSNDKSYQGFTYNNEKTDKNVTIKGDGSTVVNVYYDRNVYTVTFPKGELTCGKVEHEHSHDQCCTKTSLHIHGYGILGGCNTGKCPVGYEHTHDSRCYSDLVIEAKYGAFIGDKWPGGGWYVSNGGTTAQSYLAVMPLGGKTFYGRQTGSSTATATYYVESLPGESGTTVSGRTYKKHHTDTAAYESDWFGGGGLTVTDEERYDLEGFTCNADISTTNGSDYNGAKFYYTRNSYKLVYNDQYGKEVTESLPYEQTLSKSVNHENNYEPAYPSTLELGAYTFGGWYTDPGCTHPVDWTAKMPAAKVVLYAKWAPVTHTVKTWLTDDKTTAVNVGETGSNEQTVNHRELAKNPGTPKNGEYTFVGWFYKDADGTEHAFDFSMPVTKDLDLYAKWSSNTLVEYTIKYAVRNEDGTYTYIADDTKGSALALTTKTFEAKTGTQLKDGYQSGYFPTTSSHSIIMDIDNPAKNEYTFVYVPKAEVEYTVKYLEKGTGTQLAEPKTVTTHDAVVTETFKQISGYAPDAYQKRLVLAAENNEIIFWYVKDNTHAPVQIVHEIQNIEGDGYTEYQSSTNLNGVIGEKYDGTPLTIPGFRYNKSASTASGKLTAAGLVLTLKYDRIEYPYEFRFLEQGTNDPLAPPAKGTARYQAQVTQTAKTIPGYALVNADNQAINIAIEDPADVAKKNVKTFYYQEQTVDIKYVAVGFGTLDNVQDSNVKVLSGTVQGSTPTANEGYKFVGWFEDEACTQQVKSSWVGADNKLTPQKSVPYGDQKGYGAATYYAKFERDVFDLTIEKKAASDSNIDPNQTFVFRVRGDGVDMQVVITGDGQQTIKNLPVGDYTITEDTSWSWKYKPVDSDTRQLEAESIENGVATVTFENENKGTNWLTSLAKALNVWKNNGATVERDRTN